LINFKYIFRFFDFDFVPLALVFLGVGSAEDDEVCGLISGSGTGGGGCSTASITSTTSMGSSGSSSTSGSGVGVGVIGFSSGSDF